MKTIKGFVIMTFLVTTMAVSMPTLAQQTPNSEAARNENYDDDNDRGGDWGWIGILGLIGLAGLAGKKRDEPVTRTTTNQPQTKYAP